MGVGGERPHHRPGLREHGLTSKLRQAKVQDLRHSILRKHDIGGLDITMYDAMIMGRRQPFRKLGGNFKHFLDLQRRSIDSLLERFPFVEVHDDEHLTFRGLTDVVDRADVGMLKS